MLVLLSALLLAGASAGPSGGWSLSASQDHELVVKPMFMLRHAPGAVAALKDFVAEVSTPGRSNYGAHLDMAGLKERLPVAEGAREAVLALLAKHGVDQSKISVSTSGDMVHAEVSRATAQVMFATKFHQYEDPRTNTSIVRAEGGHTTPSQINAHVYMVGNLNEFPETWRPISVEMPQKLPEFVGDFGSDCKDCTGKTTPAVLAARYELDLSESPVTSKDTGMAVAEFQSVYYDTASLDYYQKQCSLKQKVQVDHQIGTNRAFPCWYGGDCIEALLDIQYIKAVAAGITLTNIYNDDLSLLNWAKQVDDLGDAGPSVHSISYADDEIQQGSHAPSGMTASAYMEATNVQFAKLAARGISVFVASGDQGVCGRSGCADRFHPDFPASSPYVTTVGGTDFVVQSVIGEEKAWNSSGGGFSDTFATPEWQQDAVKSYLAAATKAGNLPTDAAFNRTGRGFPDVAALGGHGNPYCVAAKETPFKENMRGVAGTSAATPVLAGMVARINEARKAKGMPCMGFMNPWIYKHAEVFHDVTSGKNNDKGDAGFSAMAGWDPATGMGTPSYKAMFAAALETDVVVV